MVRGAPRDIGDNPSEVRSMQNSRPRPSDLLDVALLLERLSGVSGWQYHQAASVPALSYRGVILADLVEEYRRLDHATWRGRAVLLFDLTHRPVHLDIAVVGFEESDDLEMVSRWGLELDLPCALLEQHRDLIHKPPRRNPTTADLPQALPALAA